MGTSRIIWGKWDCRDCGTRGISAQPPPGEDQPRCPNCGNAREAAQGEKAYLDNAREASGRVIGAVEAKTAEEVAVATAGPDWNCGFCGGDNRARFTQCQACGAKRGAKSRELPPEDAVVRTAAPRDYWQYMRFFPFVFFGGGILCGGAYVAFDFWAGEKHGEPGTVVSARWTHTMELQRFTATVAEDWQSSLVDTTPVMPVDGVGEVAGVQNIRDCHDKHHHDDHVACGTQTVCHDVSHTESDGEDCHQSCSTSDNGNGSFTENCDEVCTPRSHTVTTQECHDETRYCDVPVYQTACSFDTWQWQTVETRKTTDEGPERDEWPTFEGGGALDRFTRTPTYEVRVRLGSGADAKEGLAFAKYPDQYAAFAAASRVIIPVPNWGEPDFDNTSVPP